MPTMHLASSFLCATQSGAICPPPHIQLARHREREALSLESASGPADVMVQAMSSPRRAARRKSTQSGHSELTTWDKAPAGLTLSVYFLDGTLNRVSVPANATVHDVLLTLRGNIGLRADADFSLFLREVSLSGDVFHCLPDAMRAEDADAQALSDTKRLVYKRRLTLSKPLGATSVLEDGMGSIVPNPSRLGLQRLVVVRLHTCLQPLSSRAYTGCKSCALVLVPSLGLGPLCAVLFETT